MNFNINLTRKLKKPSPTIAHTSSATSSSSSSLSSVSTSSSPTTVTNVKTTTETEAAEVSTSSVGNYKDIIIKKNFISFSFTSCASSTSSSSMFIPQNKKITQLNYSTGMCETKTTTAETTIPTTTISAAPEAPRATTTEVMLPLTSMSSKQITLTRRVNIMDKDVESIAAETATTTTTLTNKANKPLQSHIPTATTKTAATTTKYLPILAATTTTTAAKICRKHCLSIKMPLRHLILTIMTAVVFSMEFTICSSSSTILQLQHQQEHQLTTIQVQNNTHLPTTESKNKSSKINDNLQNLPVTSTTPNATAAASSTTMTLMFASNSVPSSLTIVDDRPPLKSLESAALVEKSPSTSSLLTSTFDESSSVMLSTLTGRGATIAPTPSAAYPSSISFDNYNVDGDVVAVDGNGSSELLSFPTSKLNIFNASDLPPLSEAEQAAKDLLTKGFSIPTYLPPFPVFAVADLPAYLNTVSSTTTTESPATHPRSSDDYDQNSLENLLYFDNLSEHQQHGLQGQHQHRKLQVPKRNSSLASANVTVQVGNHAYLPCHIHRLQNKPVSWVRLRDGHIISVDQTTFIADQRFQAIFQDDKEFTWSLQIKYVQHTDEGWYECQASSEPKMSAKVYLQVIVPLTELIGDQSRFVKAGSKVALHCIVRGTLDPPQYIIWYRDKTQISDDNIMGWYTQLDRNIFGNSGDNQNTIGSLIIPFVRKMDSGNYTCQPSNSASVSVDLHVLSGEYSASAIMSAARTSYTLNDYYLLLLLFLLMLLHRT